MRIGGWIAGTAAAALGFAMLTGADVLAGKPGGGGGGVVEGGLAYVEEIRYDATGAASSTYVARRPDGSARTEIASCDAGSGRYFVPSRSTHGGVRWFVQYRIDGAAGDFHVVSESGQAVRVTECTLADGSTVEPDSEHNAAPTVGEPRWVGADDRAITFVGRRIVAGVATDAGIWRVDLDWTGVVSRTLQPVEPVRVLPLEFGSTVESPGRILVHHAWDPSGLRVAYGGTPAHPGVRVLDTTTGASALVSGSDTWDPYGRVRVCEWAPTGGDDRLLCWIPGAQDSLWVTSLTGSRTLVVTEPTGTSKTWYYLHWGAWSPATGFVLYELESFNVVRRTSETDVRRATSAGESSTNLTNDLSGVRCHVLGWR